MTPSAPLCWAVIAVKAPGEGKTRLAGVLDASARERLVTAMLKRVVDAAQGCHAVERVCLVGPSNHGLAVTLLNDEGAGLNEALSSATQQLQGAYGSDEAVGESARDGATDPVSSPGRRWPAPQRVIVLAGDLPQVDAADLAMLADVPDDAIAIAPDRHGTGTNALSLPASAIADFAFRFGTGSFAAHRGEAWRLGYKANVQLSAGLEKDIDEPADLPDAIDCLEEA
ncbi:2-phospho-L-lactate guanylyltransferase [Novosphingobium chloroacetimidivorans]|uniref:2-phospho-L-lactate guanylyltransferase n=1 Tax=Novosphingobium chloroacetimidivorans TaxID=1428314 RepID=A0A7W7NXC8_9SPHN|nr:NTP transferase domain-containing protein [Novosphingobium chloroacetimidivorans]MBB4858997.1 2-phospho-L-lactate guanylyltransferase [Novosphingobium chloroacetimidivorans]